MKKYLRAAIHTLLVLKQCTPWGHGICNSLDELSLPTHAGAMDNFRQAAGGSPEILRAPSVTYCGTMLYLEQKESCAHHSGGIFKEK